MSFAHTCARNENVIRSPLLARPPEPTVASQEARHERFATARQVVWRQCLADPHALGSTRVGLESRKDGTTGHDASCSSASIVAIAVSTLRVPEILT